MTQAGEIQQREFCTTQSSGHVLIVTIDRPEVLNSLNIAASIELGEVFDGFEADEQHRVAIVTGAGEKAFCAGLDLKAQSEAEGLPQWPMSGFAGLTERYGGTKPIIAAVNGIAAGGGFELALACDLIIASENARFSLPEARIGLAALAGGVHRLSREIPRKHAMGMLLTGRSVPAAEGVQLGFVNEVTPAGEVMDAARRWAQKIAECAPLSILATKELAIEGMRFGTVKDAMNARYPAVEKMVNSEDFVEGPRAFVEKRKPNWKGA